MLFAQINAGHYFIIEDDRVIAEIKRFYERNPRNPDWTISKYEMVWRDSDAIEIFRTLPEIHEIYAMENYPGYGRVLKNASDNSGPPVRARQSKRRRHY